MILSAEQGFTPAIHHLGLFVINGVGFGKDMELGMKLVGLAANMGHHVSKLFVIRYYKMGGKGPITKIFAYLFLQFVELFDPIRRLLPGNMFGPSRLIYFRQVSVENASRRDVNGEIIDGSLEAMLENFLANQS